ncbi:4-(cytidine 5'-diphospho)-2-C-methyl-D-erythritol kinase [Jiella sp. CBK1P-4]|uniref:4-diphosphocytidyl-2-C-methyl-D-erythritol kinase n=2 Tax=Jiella avicenniae TaxID=2907202 RepID=A0A9X1T4L8_9HYPH|nr:4-(cytidine 5'-diphospho)-2-C-methyl-D-erythritol kinase [Jiella avicenniae]MCE7028706.1 4-(cytidine 5'-diphospho)-2-C-methyl-D-erythritol kinase [Jiella avicenniae]
MDAVTVPAECRPAPAKVNLALHVVGRRDDGYHLLESLVVFDAGACDEIAVLPRANDAVGDREREAGIDRLDVSGRFASAVPAGNGNILLKAAALARAELATLGLKLPPLDIALSKHLPVAAGIGGGSADAAALLALVSADVPDEARAALAAAAIRLGADVPMCLAGRAAFVSGIGEAIRPVEAMPQLAMLLVNPGIAVETAAVFRMLARRDNPPMPALPVQGFRATGELVAYLAETRNDLALAAGSLAPEIENARARLLAAGALFARMSGSGATVFGLFADTAARDEAAQRIAGEEPGWWLSRDPRSAAPDNERSSP